MNKNADKIIQKIKSTSTKIKDIILKKPKQFLIVGASLVVVVGGIITITNSSKSEKVVLAKVTYPTGYYGNTDYFFREIKQFDKVKVSNAKFKFKKNSNSNTTDRFPYDVEYEFVIQNITDKDINNIGYSVFFKEPKKNNKFDVRPMETINLKAGEKQKIKINTFLYDKDNNAPKVNTYQCSNYYNDYVTLCVFQNPNGSKIDMWVQPLDL